MMITFNSYYIESYGLTVSWSHQNGAERRHQQDTGNSLFYDVYICVEGIKINF